MMKQKWGLDRNVLRPTHGDPRGAELHHWSTGAKENQQLNPGGPSNRQKSSGKSECWYLTLFRNETKRDGGESTQNQLQVAWKLPHSPFPVFIDQCKNGDRDNQHIWRCLERAKMLRIFFFLVILMIIWLFWWLKKKKNALSSFQH